MMEDCFEAGLREFDFLRGDEPYKTRMDVGEAPATPHPLLRPVAARPAAPPGHAGAHVS
jgi:CelD/BcsL family acetyltransferase involved in cellulose biosynthesis